MYSYRKTIDTSLETDVLGVRGGSAGATTAVAAAHQGLAVILVERATDFKPYRFQAPYTLE